MNRRDLLSLGVAFAVHIAFAVAVYALAPLADIHPERCDNNLDDDADGLIDCDDPDCSTQPKVAPACRLEDCDNNLDDDEDGLIDCDDPDCGEDPIDVACLPPAPIVVKVVPPPPPPVVAEEPEVVEPEAPEEATPPEPAPEPTPPTAAPPKITESRPPPSGKPPSGAPQEEVPLVFGQPFEGGTEGLAGMEVPEGNTYAIDPALSAKVEGKPKAYAGGTPGGTGTSPEPPASAPAAPPPVKEVSAVEITSPPKQLSCDDSVAKDFPQEAREAGISGKVFVEILIDETGKIAEAKIAQGLGYGLDELALKRVKTCTFSPALKGDTPVAFRIKRFPVVLLPE